MSLKFYTGASIAIIILTFCYFVLHYGLNFPNADDFDSLLDFTNQFIQSSSYADKFALLFERHTQHFRTIDRLVALALYYVNGEINFYFYIVLGLIGILIVFYLLNSLVEHKSNLLTLSLALLLFQPCYAEVTQWANTCIQVIWVNIPVLIAFKTFRSRFYLSVLLACIALLIQGNGILTLPIILLAFIHFRNFDLKFVSYLASFILSLAIFNFNRILTPDPSNTNSYLIPKITYTLEMLGSGIGYFDRSLSFYIGLILLSITIFFILTLKKKEETLACFVIFLILSCMATAQFRYGLDHNSSFTTSRYTLISILALISLLCVAHNRFFQSRFYLKFSYGLCLLCLLFNLTNYYKYTDQYVLRNEMIADSMLRWNLFEKGLLYQPALRSEQILGAAESLGTFSRQTANLEKYTLPEGVINTNLQPKRSKVTWALDHALCNDKYIIIDGWAILKKTPSYNQRIYLKINNQQLSQAQTRTRPDVNILLTKHAYPKPYTSSGFFILLDRGKIVGEIESMALFYLGAGGAWSEKSITLEGICAGAR